MKLRFSPLSPFVRKVRVVALETGQHDQMELVPTVTTDPESDLWRDNPLVKIPALVFDNGDSLYDSAVICEYLDSQHQGPKLFPGQGDARWAVLRRQALADGMMDAAVLRRYESLRPQHLQSADWDAAQKRRVDHGLVVLEKEAPGFGETIDIGTLTVAVMLDYLSFRFAVDDWTGKCPALAAWHRKISTRPSLATTLPHA